jgi:hypothetical protein
MSQELITRDNQVVGTAIVMPTATPDHAIALAAAVLDKRITTARQWPRSVSRFKQEAIALLQDDIETARSAEYRKPVGDGSVTGPSVRLAEIACMCWGNIEVEIGEPVITETSVTVHATAWDLERNVRVPGISSTSIVQKNGKRYAQHMIENAIMATASKARRNAIQAAIPRAYINDLLEAARKVANSNVKSVEQTRKDMLEHFARTYRVTPEQVFAYLDVEGVDDIGLAHIDELRLVSTALKEGEPIEEYFGPIKTKAEMVKEKIAERRGGTDTATTKQVEKQAATGGLTDAEKAAILKAEAAEAGRKQ